MKLGWIIGIIGTIAAIGGASIGIPYMTASQRKSNAEELAIEWAKTLYSGQKATAVCQATDSDGDGYVSYTVRVGTDRVPLDCHSYMYFSWGNTCREQLPALKKVSNQ